jgi:hypothetical protein
VAHSGSEPFVDAIKVADVLEQVKGDKAPSPHGSELPQRRVVRFGVVA